LPATSYQSGEAVSRPAADIEGQPFGKIRLNLSGVTFASKKGKDLQVFHAGVESLFGCTDKVHHRRDITKASAPEQQMRKIAALIRFRPGFSFLYRRANYE
jgi:hypothetical protein